MLNIPYARTDIITVEQVATMVNRLVREAQATVRRLVAEGEQDVRRLPTLASAIAAYPNTRVVATVAPLTLSTLQVELQVATFLETSWVTVQSLRMSAEVLEDWHCDRGDVKAVLREAARRLSERANILGDVRVEPPGERQLREAWEKLRDGADRTTVGAQELRWEFVAVDDIPRSADRVVVRCELLCGIHVIVAASEQTESVIDLTDETAGVGDLASCASVVAHMATDALRGLQEAHLT